MLLLQTDDSYIYLVTNALNIYEGFIYWEPSINLKMSNVVLIWVTNLLQTLFHLNFKRNFVSTELNGFIFDVMSTIRPAWLDSLHFL